MARKKAHEEHANHERWLVSYADFITLLFAFFVTMYAISQVDADKLGRMVQSMESAFNSGVFEVGETQIPISKGSSAGIGISPPIDTNSSPLGLDSDNPPFDPIEEAVAEGLEKENAAAQVILFKDPRGLVIRLAEAGFFDSGKAEIKQSAISILDAIARSLLPFNNHIRVEGHTDDIPIHNARFGSNWELSSARATFVIDYLLRLYSFPPHKISAAGYGQYHPVSENDTAEGRARNRRVDIVVLNTASTVQEPG